MTTMKVGVATVITRIIPMAERNLYKNERMLMGIISSMIKMSIENRFNTRPSGVVSKNDIGHLRMFFSSLLCIILEANTTATAREMVLTRVNRDCTPPRPA